MALVAVVALLAGLVLAVAFTELTSNDGKVSAATTAPVEPDTAPQNSVPTAPPVAETNPAGASSAAPAG